MIQEIKFGNQTFDALVCLDANLPGPEIFNLLGSIPVLAADGAALKLIDLGINPDYVIGDLDSFFSRDNIIYPGERLIRVADQESNDFEKTLKFAIGQDYTNILIFGFHGGELEHTLNNWSVLRRYAHRLNLCVFDSGRYGIPLNKSVFIHARKGETVSLIPQTKVLLTTRNLKWELHHESLEFGRREGARNEATAESVLLKIHSGELLLFFDSRLPFAPEYKVYRKEK